VALPKQVPLIEYHPKAKGASAARLRQLAGSIPFQGEVPSTKFLESSEDDCPTDPVREQPEASSPTARARD
jgi:hypothetical protein